MDDIQNVVKGGENWMSMTIGRHAKGITLWVRVIPPVEEFIASLSIPSLNPNAGQDDGGAPPARNRVLGQGLNRGAPVVAAQRFVVSATPFDANDLQAAPVRMNPDEPQVDDLVGTYGKRWLPIGDEKLEVYRVHSDLDNQYYTLSAVGQGLLARNSEVNLSFLRFKGISGGQGIKFMLLGPMGRSDARNMGGRVLSTAKQFFTEYIAPINLNLRITSTEV
jgi:hypothetical protein